MTLVISGGTALSWGEVFEEYAPALTAYARSRGVREPADLVQDVFVAAVERAPGFVGDRSGLRSLLFTIAFRQIADEHRGSTGARRPWKRSTRLDPIRDRRSKRSSAATSRLVTHWRPLRCSLRGSGRCPDAHHRGSLTRQGG